ncbi:MAG: hypothetical protein NXI20_17120 [bacterium]|nr:hypothetical protein [bacterium]
MAEDKYKHFWSMMFLILPATMLRVLGTGKDFFYSALYFVVGAIVGVVVFQFVKNKTTKIKVIALIILLVVVGVAIRVISGYMGDY